MLTAPRTKTLGGLTLTAPRTKLSGAYPGETSSKESESRRIGPESYTL